MIAALYVQTGGPYFGLPGVDPWDAERDARLYAGPWPVVAHPPCERWCRLAPFVESVNGYRVGDDGGCFAAALAAVRAWGGVLEHPASSYAWRFHGLNRPHPRMGWIPADDQGGWTCHIEQGHYGHPARKATWLYAAQVRLPNSLMWGRSTATAYVTDGGGRIKGPRQGVLRLGGKAANATPPAFRDLLLDIAATAERGRETA